MLNIKKMTCVLILAIMIAPLAATEGKIDPARHKQYLQFAKAAYDKDLESKSIATPVQMAKPVQRAMNLLMERSGEPATAVFLRITNEIHLNAVTYVGPYFAITKGLLDLLDGEAQKRSKADGELGKSRGIDYYRERLVAGVMAHEIGHFLAGHGLRSLAEQEKQIEKPSEALIFATLKNSMQHSQDDEFEADKIGATLMAKAGYDSDFLFNVLTLLNQDMQKTCEKSEGKDCRANSYTNSHPSGHERLAKFKNEEQSYHEQMARIERAVSAIELGLDLSFAIGVIDSELKINPHNAYYQRIYAIGLHKAWLETVSLTDQKLRAILTVPTFYDKLANKPVSRKGEKTIPGNKLKYLNAAKAYRVSLENPQTAEFVSGYAALLVYDPDSEKEANRLSALAFSTYASLATANNHALVLYLSGKPDAAGKLFNTLANEVDSNLGKAFKIAENDEQVAAALRQRQLEIFKMQTYDKNYITNDQTILLNLALYAHATGQKDAAKNVAQYFISSYDCTSLWSKHLAKLNGITLEEPESSSNSVAGIQLGSSLNDVVTKLGKPAKVVKTSDDVQIYYYPKHSIRVVTQSGGVRGLTVSAGSSVLINDKIGLGTSRADVEKTLGKTKRSAQGYALYGTANPVGVRYEDDKVVEYVLQ